MRLTPLEQRLSQPPTKLNKKMSTEMIAEQVNTVIPVDAPQQNAEENQAMNAQDVVMFTKKDIKEDVNPADETPAGKKRKSTSPAKDEANDTDVEASPDKMIKLDETMPAEEAKPVEEIIVPAEGSKPVEETKLAERESVPPTEAEATKPADVEARDQQAE